ncbi:hypothetical protein AYJ54_13745 [Bradyrhizobium centrolobii]|uniref:Uncharacterized protein n=2 Tax=Bradyrhizobium TaxID=374 RepID=A0A176YNG1_9BRAD|nr:hypothetical protein AXW67_29695 [Bradyrhizobium neotropicale]OAF08710.1 hypothetical protein AYJ54_13745 [Bradyrhizobium centrolobii]
MLVERNPASGPSELSGSRHSVSEFDAEIGAWRGKARVLYLLRTTIELAIDALHDPDQLFGFGLLLDRAVVMRGRPQR